MESVTRINRSTGDSNKLKKSRKTTGYTLEKYEDGILVSSVEIFIGGKYIVTPENTKKLKHRNRECSIVGFEVDNLRNPISAKVKFSDNNRTGSVHLSDLTEQR